MIDRAALKAQLVDQLAMQVEWYLDHVTEEMSLADAETAVQQWKDRVGQQILTTTLRGLPPGAAPPFCPCGGKWHGHGQRTKQIRTLQGMVRIQRSYWYCGACQHGVCPWDERLGIVGTQTSAGIQREAAWRAARLTMDETAEDMERAYPVRLSGRQVEALVIHALAATEDVQAAQVWEAAEDRWVW